MNGAAISGPNIDPPANDESVIFVVEGDAAVRNSLSFALGIEGYSVRTFATATALLSESAMLRRGCLIADHSLPDSSGLDLIRDLRSRGIRLPAILLAGDAGPQLRARATRAGVTIVEKPLLGDGLTRAIGNALAEAF
jgi:FixJ family two-component response regulator